ncbi:MAG: DUF4340 domain-containing protein [Candidatus Hydrogenedentes bacterium]|nr:DUF4340 domain-containing protein [Candidatus Hydrogenedentota bacterium]
MSARVTAILFAVFVALCAAYWWAISRENTNKVREFEAKKVFSVKAADLRQISVQRTDEVATVAERSDEKSPWAITKPYPIQAYQHAWARVAEAFANLSNERPIDPSGKDLAQYGLDKPRVTVSATTAGGQENKISLGAADPTQTRVYALVEGQGVFLVPKETVTDLDRALLDLRNRFMVTVGEAGITHLEFAFIAGKEKTPAGYQPGDESLAVVLDKGADGSWALVKPVTGIANKTLAEKLASEMQNLTGRGYVDKPESLDDYGLNPPRARVTVRSGADGEPQTVYFGSVYKGDEKGGLYAKQAASPAVFVIDSGIIERLPKTPDGFRDKRLFTKLDGEIQSLHYVAGLTDFTLELDPAKGWRVTQPAVPDSDQMVISNFIGLLKVMTCVGFVEDVKPEAGLDRPAIELTIGMKDRPEPARIRVGAQIPGKETFYAAQDSGTVVELNRTDVNALTRNLADFRPKEFLRFDKVAATAVNLRFDGTDYVFEKSATTGVWTIKAPAGKVWESQNDMTSLVTTLSTAHMTGVEASTAPTDLTPYGLNAPLATVTVTVQSGQGGATGATLGPLNIGKSVENNSQQRYASVQGRSEVFRAEQALVDTLRDILKGVRDQ